LLVENPMNTEITRKSSYR